MYKREAKRTMWKNLTHTHTHKRKNMCLLQTVRFFESYRLVLESIYIHQFYYDDKDIISERSSTILITSQYINLAFSLQSLQFKISFISLTNDEICTIIYTRKNPQL